MIDIVISERHGFMVKVTEFITFESGSPQFRIKETVDKAAPLYFFYGQNELENDLSQIEMNQSETKSIQTFDPVLTVAEGDIVFSLISGKAAIVGKNHAGFLITQNYLRLVVDTPVIPSYIVYLLNEDLSIKHQFQLSLQGSSTLKYTVKQVKELRLPALPTIERQSLIGKLYLKQLHLEALQKNLIELKTKRLLFQLKEASSYERSAI
ncbi:restriction endonuclease subunit M [Streptococcus anginosus]|uniref:restriction endonuclease subunit M n=2 Tax=Streptococcus anginosus TaxID=1328 RepID=UPI0021F88510|nr:restriction endonuclease subunit M [Streptococcus anginosus]MCW1035429.1 restriction endonuclease subunit M [Streptococcus anginosus]